MMDRPAIDRDKGAVLPLVLVVTVVLALVVVAVATYTGTALRYGQVVESRADRLASADAAMGDAIEQLRLRRNIGALCSTLGGDGAGVSLPFPQQINGVDVTVNCRIVGGKLPPVDGWAMVITGLGPGGNPLAAAPSFEFTLGGNPEIGGPVYVNNPTTSWMRFSKETTIVEGDIWYPDDSCANAPDKNSSDINFARSAVPVDSDLKFDPTTRGVYCLNRTWTQLFGGGPSVPDMSALPNNPPPDTTTHPGCRVFSPGVYTTQPDLAKNNYFRSGNYRFQGIGKLSLSGQAVHFGHDPTLAGTYPITDNANCDLARQNDPDTGGATLYTGGNTQIELGPNSAFEISRRAQVYVRPGGAESTSFVAFQSVGSSLSSSQSLIEASSGAKKEFASHGLFWAPHSSVLFETVPAQKAASLRGGAVLGRFEGGVSAAAAGFVIEVPTATLDTKLLLTAVATDSRGDTSVRVVADYRPTSGQTAVNSWRVVD